MGFSKNDERRLVGMIEISLYKRLIAIDEISMVDILLMSKLFKALDNTDFRLLMVGDYGQLPPEGFGLCFHRLVDTGNTERFKVIKLREVHRTKATGMLHQVAMEAHKGELPALFNYLVWRKGRDIPIAMLHSKGNA
ncbi:TPA: AAA family ATPase [Photobacterium damselae]